MTAPFTYEEGSVLIRLILAHLIADFILQTEKGILSKKEKLLRSGAFWNHGLYITVVTALFMWNKLSWPVLALITISHLTIDYLKLYLTKHISDTKYKHKELWLFVTDQCMHGIILLIAWLILINGFHKLPILINDSAPSYRFLLRIMAYLVAIGPVTYLIKFLTTRWADEVTETGDSLKDAGKWIGMLERVLIITLVFIEQYTAIGFLVTAKSILRLIDKPELSAAEKENPKIFSSRKHTEYVLIGTFLSFGSALLIGLIMNWLLKI